MIPGITQHARKMKPTRKHRPAIWECMLGTVYAMNEHGQVMYCDYRYPDAIEFSGVNHGSDVRIAKNKERHGLSGPRVGQLAVWMIDHV